jgi:hypothetical protein
MDGYQAMCEETMMGLFSRGGADKIISGGTRARGTIVAIAVSQTHDDPPKRVDEYVVHLDAAGGNRRFGVRQVLKPDEHVRLGMEVLVWVKDDDLFIDWAGTLAAAGLNGSNVTDRWKSVKDEGLTGITDGTIGLDKAGKKGVPVTIKLEAVRMDDFMFGLALTPTFVVTVTMQGDEPYEVEMKRQEVPFYAAHLAAAGNTLPGFARESRLDKVQIDWPAAAMANPGVGVAPSADAHKASPEPSAAMSMGGAASAPAPAPQGDAPPPIDGVTWEQFVAIEWGFVRDKVKPKDWDMYAQQHGVAPGAWTGAAKQWNLKMRRDANLQRMFGAASR